MKKGLFQKDHLRRFCVLLHFQREDTRWVCLLRVLSRVLQQRIYKRWKMHARSFRMISGRKAVYYLLTGGTSSFFRSFMSPFNSTIVVPSTSFSSRFTRFSIARSRSLTGFCHARISLNSIVSPPLSIPRDEICKLDLALHVYYIIPLSWFCLSYDVCRALFNGALYCWRYAREKHALRSRDSINIEIFAQKDHVIKMINNLYNFFSRLSIFHSEENKLRVWKFEHRFIWGRKSLLFYK